jgi:phage terminase small subunit
MMSNKKLSPKMRAFAENYMISLNATQSYRQAGYKATGHAAEVNAARLLRNAEVAAAIAQAMKERSERTKIRADRVVCEIARIAFLDIGKAFNEDGTLSC